MTDPSPALDRRLGPLDAAAIVVSNVIGGGIFFVPISSRSWCRDARAILLVWIVGGALAFAGAMAYAELAALRPHAGGEYVYLREAYGPLAAFLTGWTSFVAGFSGAIAASAVALADYLGRFVPAAGDATPLLTCRCRSCRSSCRAQTLVALAVIALLTLVHVRGLGPGPRRPERAGRRQGRRARRCSSRSDSRSGTATPAHSRRRGAGAPSAGCCSRSCR